MKGSAEHSSCTCVDRPHPLPMNNYTTTLRTENAFEKRRRPASACLFSVFFTIRRGTLHYIIEDDGSSTSQTPTTHDTNTCVKLTIVTDLSFSERIAIANLSFHRYFSVPYFGLARDHGNSFFCLEE